MKLVIMTAQIGHYHDARYRAVANFETDFCVLAVQNDADFPEFMKTGNREYPVYELFSGAEDYRSAVSTDRVWQTVHRRLDELDPLAVAVAGWATPESFAAIAWARSRYRRLIIMSESQKHDAERFAWREWLKFRILRLCDSALVGGPSHRDYAASLGKLEDRVFLGYDVVDNDYFVSGADDARADDQNERARLKMPARYLLASSRFIPKKNLPKLVRAYAAATKTKVNVPDLVILGDGPDRELIENEISNTGTAELVHVPGFRGYSDLPAIYGLSLGFVHVSTSEQWGLVINEAAAAALPIIASTACGATPSLVRNGENGFTVDANDEAAITDALARLMQMSPEGRKSMGMASRRIVKDWGPERFASGLLGAVNYASKQPLRGVTLLDHAMLRLLARRTISRVP